MPGSPGVGPKAPIDKRSRGELIAWIVIFPLVGAGILLIGVLDALAHSSEWSLVDWSFRFGWCVVVGPVLAIGLPATALRELLRRKREARR